MIGLPISDRMLNALAELYERKSAVKQYPVLGGIAKNAGVPKGVNNAILDGCLMLGYLLSQAEPLADEKVHELLDLLAQKWKSKGGREIAHGQIADICYEGAVYCYLMRSGLNATLLPEGNNTAPDLSFAIKLHDCDKELKLAIDCKNVRRAKDDPYKIAKTVAERVIESRKKWDKWQKQGYTDFCFFVDLPTTIVSPTDPFPVRYGAVAQSVVRQLWLEGHREIDPFRILYTHLFQERMSEIMAELKSMRMTIFLPIWTHTTSLRVERAVFLSFLFRQSYESANLNNLFNYVLPGMLFDIELENLAQSELKGE